MAFSRCFLCAAVLTLMAVSMETSSSGGQRSHSFDLSGQGLTDLYNSQVYNAERMRRPKGSNPSAVGPFSHSGVRVTLGDGSQWLIHKGDGYGISSQTVVTDAQHMSSAWEPISTRDFQGTKTVSDFVKAGGPNYNVFLDNCHLGSRRMMNQ